MGFSKRLVALFVAAGFLGWCPITLSAESFHWGNDFYLGASSQNTVINNSDAMVSLRFTAHQTTALDEIAFRTGSLAPVGAPKAIVTLRADDNGNPGAVLASTGQITTLTQNASIYSSLTSAYTVTAGTVYHLVIQGVDVDASNTFSVLYNFNGGSYVNAFATGQADVAQARLTTTNGGGSWTVGAQSGTGSAIAAMAARNSETGAAVSQAASSPLATASAGGVNQLAERFVYTGPDQGIANAVTLKLRNAVTGSPITGDLSVRLLDANDSLMSVGSLSASLVTGTAWSDYTISFGEKVALEQDGIYKLLLTASESANGCYGVYAPGTNFQSGDHGAFYDATFGGTDAYLMLSSNGGSTFANYVAYDLFFRFEMEPIPEPAAWVSLLGSGGLLWMCVRRQRRL